jgi:hypothetical protein
VWSQGKDFVVGRIVSKPEVTLSQAVFLATSRTEPLLGHDVIVMMLLQFRNKLGPIGGKRKLDSLETANCL